ncbi:helix-turn-helix transcriptional regulator [Microbispora hainanensis]|uniref:Helix-turn-helix domain-containing protein n=1 Tax=Microbispora hainanensis TaxID=568844 RepID=A0A544YSY7_9ACTN|nr:helix-turn-helix transcriptional regulator [Microbispora hainanensis]TQS19662.1 helix-turn-helix domain-containing protein [Microbispora hainanensis]
MDGDLGRFLRSRRARIRPEDVGLPAHGRRRVSGLRREEVALLAGMSAEYYIRLEQQRVRNVSDEVLDAVARVLRLDGTERAHLRRLLRPPGDRRAPLGQVRPGVRMLLDAAGSVPAFVLGPRMDVLAWNALADAITGFSDMPEGERNMARQTFLTPRARSLYRDWPAVAAETISYLRLYAGRHPGDPLLGPLVAGLSADPGFARLWEEHRVAEKTFGVKLLRHPELGDLDFAYETLALPGDPDLLVVMYTADPASPTGRVLARLWRAHRGDLDEPDVRVTAAD